MGVSITWELSKASVLPSLAGSTLVPMRGRVSYGGRLWAVQTNMILRSGK